MIYFCTYFDSNYLVRGLALYRSLARHARPFKLWILCLDDTVYEVFEKLGLPEVIPIALRNLEESDSELLLAKDNRSRIEYYFTCTPSLCLHILENYPEVDIITYLDADIFLFSDPSPVYEELGEGSILVVGHRFPSHLEELKTRGLYNVSFLCFRRHATGFQCLKKWRKQCLDWCYDRVEDGRFADQKYLDDWPVHFRGVVVVQNKGAGVAPWNLANYSLRFTNGEVLVDLQPLVFFHFHNLKRIVGFLYYSGLGGYGVSGNSLIKRHIFGPYLRELKQARLLLTRSAVAHNTYESGSIRNDDSTLMPNNNIIRRIAKRIRTTLSLMKMFLHGQLLVVIGGKVV